jgi:hypothetical protein
MFARSLKAAFTVLTQNAGAVCLRTLEDIYKQDGDGWARHGSCSNPSAVQAGKPMTVFMGDSSWGLARQESNLAGPFDWPGYASECRPA